MGSLGELSVEITSLLLTENTVMNGNYHITMNTNENIFLAPSFLPNRFQKRILYIQKVASCEKYIILNYRDKPVWESYNKITSLYLTSQYQCQSLTYQKFVYPISHFTEGSSLLHDT